MTNAKNSENTNENAKNERSTMETTTREWVDLKPGDVVDFNGEWREVFDAFPTRNLVVVKLLDAAGEITTHYIRSATAGKATCRV